MLCMNRLRFLVLLSAFCPLLSSRGFAQHMNDKQSPCRGTVATADMARCFSKAKDSSDARLNSVYQRILKRLDPEDAERLKKTERLWMQYRDENCSAERELYRGGSAAPVVYLACLEAMTRARAAELQETYAVRLKD